jgi:hypothetical protein
MLIHDRPRVAAIRLAAPSLCGRFALGLYPTLASRRPPRSTSGEPCIRKPRPARSARSTDASRRPPRSTSGEPEPGRRSTDASRAPHQASPSPRPARSADASRRPDRSSSHATCLACPGGLQPVRRQPRAPRWSPAISNRHRSSCDLSTLIVILE